VAHRPISLRPIWLGPNRCVDAHVRNKKGRHEKRDMGCAVVLSRSGSSFLNHCWKKKLIMPLPTCMWRELLFGVEHGALVRTGWIMHGGVPPPYYYNYNDYGGLREKVEGLILCRLYCQPCNRGPRRRPTAMMGAQGRCCPWRQCLLGDEQAGDDEDC
jgi:hypothetical protein